MARAMGWVDVFEVLLQGGYISSETNNWTGRSSYIVHKRMHDRQPSKTM